jgi:hypothetical protein
MPKAFDARVLGSQVDARTLTCGRQAFFFEWFLTSLPDVFAGHFNATEQRVEMSLFMAQNQSSLGGRAVDGRRSTKVVPLSGSVSKVIMPPCFFTTVLKTNASPCPVPPPGGFVGSSSK